MVDLDIYVPLNKEMPAGRNTIVLRYADELIYAADSEGFSYKGEENKHETLDTPIDIALNPYVKENRAYMARGNKLIQMNVDQLKDAEIV
mmetsp:Transcript_26519/g.4628  ORF Transcript_26519/g.4628 Transcript_26519/m.4628 type:complete len:90 (+) Transcript_26519:1067-1336(+)